MSRGLGLSIAWISATIVSVVIAGAAVGSVRSQVTEQPTALGSPTAAALAVDAVSTTIQPSTASPVVPTSVPAPPPPQTSSTVKPPIPETVGSTAAPVPPSSSTTTQPRASTKAYSTDGGTVRIAISGQSVTFSGAVPNPGWKVEVEDTGPEQVKVKFEQNDHGDDAIEFRARFEDGELKISMDDH